MAYPGIGTLAARLTILFALFGAPAFAGALVLQGAFTSDGDVALFSINVASTSVVTFQSWGYAGGTVATLPAPTVIPSGGFSPNLVLFDGAGTQIASDNGGHCGITNVDPVTGTCNDPLLQGTLSAGSYTLALAEWDNVPATGLLADGFTQQGNSGFTCAAFGQSGNFCDVTTALGTVRTGNYAVSLDGATVNTPEPSGLLLGIGSLLLLRLRRSRMEGKI
jgi:hypothetical protein